MAYSLSFLFFDEMIMYWVQCKSSDKKFESVAKKVHSENLKPKDYYK